MKDWWKRHDASIRKENLTPSTRWGIRNCLSASTGNVPSKKPSSAYNATQENTAENSSLGSAETLSYDGSIPTTLKKS